MKAVFLDFDTMGKGLSVAVLHDTVDELTVYDVSTEAQLAERIRDVDIVFTNKCRLSRELIVQAQNLKLIALTATGTDNIDSDAARERGVAVANIRGYCTESVVEHVFGCLLTLTHSLHRYRATVAAGAWQKSADPFLLVHPVRELSAMTLGVVGFGALGRGVAMTGRAFGMDVLVSARPGSKSVPDERTAFEDLLARADVISLHCPLNDDTRKLFSTGQFGAMKNTAVLINTARGGLVDSAALATALENGDIAAAAVDVLPTEPPVDGDPLLDYEGDNLVVTPHIAWASNEARQNAIDELAANTRAFLAGEERNRVV